MSTRYQGFKNRLRQGLAASLLALLAACSSAPSTQSASSNGYVLTVDISASDTQASVEQQYGGTVIAWMGNKAILKLSNQAYSQLKNKGVSLQATTNGNLNAPEASISGWNAWGGGWNAWAGGWNAWAGGWNAWAGGTSTTPTPPVENDAIWKQIKLYEANQVAVNFGKGIKVAVIDTGIDTTHPMFIGRLAPSTEWKDYVDGDAYPQEVGTSSDKGYGHGTAVAGIIAQVAPKATLLPIRVLDSTGMGNLDNVISAIYWAISKGAKVINLSLGSYDYYQPLADVLGYAASQKVLVVASSGNDGSATPTYPSSMQDWSGLYTYTYGVGSISSTGAVSSFSNYGPQVTSYASGEGIVTAYPSNQLVKATGTSFAAPLFTGALALTWSDYPSNDPRNLFIYMGNYAIYDAPNFWDKGYNYGSLNVSGMVRSAQGLPGQQLLAHRWMNTFNLWDWTQNATIINGCYYDRCAQVTGSGGYGQVVTALRPNTTYTFSAYVRVDNPAYPAQLGVKNYGGVTKTVGFNNTGWAYVSLSFTTGSTNTSAEVYLWKNSTSGNAYGDDAWLFKQ